MSSVNLQVSPTAPGGTPGEFGLLFRPNFDSDPEGGPLSRYTSRTSGGLHVNTAYTVRFTGPSSPAFGFTPGSQDLSGEVLDISTFDWIFTTSAVRIDSPRYEAALPSVPFPASGLVAVSKPGPVTVELRDGSGALVSGPVTAQRSSQVVSSGTTPANPLVREPRRTGSTARAVQSHCPRRARH
jgi:hypothetical protein